MSDSLLWLVTVVSFVLGAFYSGSETAFITCDRIRMRHLAERGNPRARRVLSMLDNPGHLLSAVLVGNNLTVTACTTAFTALSVRYWGDNGATVATLLLVPSILMFSEIIPKALFLTYANRAALTAVDPLRILTGAVYPLVRGFAVLTDALTRSLSRGSHDDGARVSVEEVLFHIADSREAGLIAPETQTLIDRAVALRGLTVGNVLTPLERISMLDYEAPIESYAAVFALERFSRFPLYRGARENVVGVMSVHEYMTGPDPEATRAVVSTPERVAIETPILDVLVGMREHGKHMVMVEQDGSVIGMTTLEDILERFVGAISDEFH